MSMYARMSPLELVGHVSAIPDASELSKALAERLRESCSQVEYYQVQNMDLMQRADELRKVIVTKENGIDDLMKQLEIRNRKIAELRGQLENAQDKIEGFMEATDPRNVR